MSSQQVWIRDKRARDLIGAWFESIADDVCEQHYRSITQEPQLSARIGQALEQEMTSSLQSELAGVGVLGHKVSVVTHDIPDRGSSSLESKSGADLYLGVEIETPYDRVSKGMLFQAKWDEVLTSETAKSLREACAKMRGKTTASFVIVYTSTGVRIASTERAAHFRKGMVPAGDRFGPFLSEVLACKRGDEAIGLPNSSGADRRAALGEMLERLAVPSGVAVRVSAPSG